MAAAKRAGPAAPSRPPSPDAALTAGPGRRGPGAREHKEATEATAGAEEKARGPRSGVMRVQRPPLPRINKIFKMAVRARKRECGGQSGPPAGSWRARVGGNGTGEAGRAGFLRAKLGGSMGRGREGSHRHGRRGCALRARAGLRLAFRPRRRSAGESRQAASRATLDGRTLGGLRGYCLPGPAPRKEAA